MGDNSYSGDVNAGNTWESPQARGLGPNASGGGAPSGGGVTTLPGADLLKQFQDLLAAYNPRFLGVSNELQGISQGNDPRLEALRNADLARTSEFFNRRGTGGSTAALNALNRTSQGFNAMELQRQDTARLGQLDVLSGFLQNATIPFRLLLQQMGVQNAQAAANMAGQSDPFLKLGPISIG